MKTAYRIARKHLGSAIVFCFGLGSLACPAQDILTMDHVILREGKVFLEQDGQSKPLQKEMTLSGGIKVQTNGLVTLSGGVEKTLPENRPFTLDGFLIAGDGRFVRLDDHIAVLDGALMMVKNGQASRVGQEITLGDGTVVLPDGVFLRPDGRRLRLLDGQMLKLDGSGIPTRDQVLIRDGHVVLQKDGSILSLGASRTIAMSDGTKVKGDGSVIFTDGRALVLRPGQRLSLPGALLRNGH